MAEQFLLRNDNNQDEFAEAAQVLLREGKYCNLHNGSWTHLWLVRTYYSFVASPSGLLLKYFSSLSSVEKFIASLVNSTVNFMQKTDIA